MNKQEYIKWLRKQDRYCNCQQVAELKTRGERLGLLEKECEAMKAETNLNGKHDEEDRAFLLKYQEKAEELTKKVVNYSFKMQELIDQGNAFVVMHYQEEGEWVTKRIPQLAIADIAGAIATVHCSNCKQQIDTVSTSRRY